MNFKVGDRVIQHYNRKGVVQRINSFNKTVTVKFDFTNFTLDIHFSELKHELHEQRKNKIESLLNNGI